MKKVINNAGLLLLTITILISCQSQPKADPTYEVEIDEWHKKRIDRLQTETGWLNLAGLFWLQEGQNSFGSDSSNYIIFPQKAAPVLGSITLDQGKVKLHVATGVEILVDDKPVQVTELRTDNDENTTVMNFGDLRWHIIQRGDRFGIRLRDLKHKRLDEFRGIDRFDVNEKWKIKATFLPYDPPKKVMITSVIETTSESDCYGAFVFSIDGKEYQVEPSGKPDGKTMSLVFGDNTNSKTTYGGGRFLVIPAPDKNGESVIDFNKAYNPPCIFSPFATCPLPTEENYLDLAVTAGEKKWGGTMIGGRSVILKKQ